MTLDDDERKNDTKAIMFGPLALPLPLPGAHMYKKMTVAKIYHRLYTNKRLNSVNYNHLFCTKYLYTVEQPILIACC